MPWEPLRLYRAPSLSRGPGGVLTEKLNGGVRWASWNNYPISHRSTFWCPIADLTLLKTLILNIPNSRPECTNYTLFQKTMAELHALNPTKTAKKPYPLAIPYLYSSFKGALPGYLNVLFHYVFSIYFFFYHVYALRNGCCKYFLSFQFGKGTRPTKLVIRYCTAL